MRVVLVGPTYPHRGGLVHYTHSLANALADLEGVEITLLSYERLFPKWLYKGGSETSQEPLALDSRVRVEKILAWNSPTSWRHGARIAKDAQLVHFQVWTGILAPSMTWIARGAQKMGAKVVATLHNVAPHESKDRVLAPLLRGFLRHADAVIVHSRGLAKGAAASLDIPPSRIHVIPHGQYAFFDRKRFTRSDARARLNIPKEGIVILCLGVIREYKGIDTALEALAHLPTKYILVIAGHNWEPWDKYRAIIDAHALADRVRIDLRYIPDEELELFYKAADVSLLSYKNFEGQSGQAITAAAFGVPIVASQVGGLVDLIEPEFTAKPGDAIAFANSIKAAVNRGTTTVIPGAAPSWPEVALKTEVLYRHLTMS